ncbi:MAG: hypothetical protein OK454_03560 [Thaumarchaeota archaeon]|nr:hypothetical protein [Nitrososphaerota archaeon]
MPSAAELRAQIEAMQREMAATEAREREEAAAEAERERKEAAAKKKAAERERRREAEARRKAEEAKYREEEAAREAAARAAAAKESAVKAVVEMTGGTGRMNASGPSGTKRPRDDDDEIEVTGGSYTDDRGVVWATKEGRVCERCEASGELCRWRLEMRGSACLPCSTTKRKCIAEGVADGGAAPKKRRVKVDKGKASADVERDVGGEALDVWEKMLVELQGYRHECREYRNEFREFRNEFREYQQMMQGMGVEMVRQGRAIYTEVGASRADMSSLAYLVQGQPRTPSGSEDEESSGEEDEEDEEEVSRVAEVEGQAADENAEAGAEGAAETQTLQ